MNNLIFVSKSVGLECLKFHLNCFKKDNNFIVVAEPDLDMIVDYLVNENIKNYCLQKDFTIELLSEVRFDWLLNLWGSYIFKNNILSKCINSLNIHPSLLPYGRGRDPVVWSIIDDVPAGATLHEINIDVDEGDIYVQEQVDYEMPITGGELYNRVINKCISLFKYNWPLIRNGEIEKIPQEDIINVKTRKRNNLLENREIHFDKLAPEEKNLIRKLLAHNFNSNYSAVLNVNGNKFNVNVDLSRVDK